MTRSDPNLVAAHLTPSHAGVEELLRAEHDVAMAQMRVVFLRISRATGPDVETLKLEQRRLERELIGLEKKMDFARRHGVR